MTTIKVTKEYNTEGKLYYYVFKNDICVKAFQPEEENEAIKLAREMEYRIKNPLPPPEDILVINID